MVKRAKEKKASRQRPRNIAQTVDAGEEQPDTRRRSRNKNRTKQNHHNNHTKCTESEDDARLQKSLSEHGLEVIEMSSDGNCLFRALSDQLYGDYGNKHATVRSDISDFMEQNKEDFQEFLEFEDKVDDDQQKVFEHYIEQIREGGEWGGNHEIAAAARLYKRNVRVYSAKGASYTVDHDGSNSNGPDLLVSYHADNHYNSVHDKGAPPKKIDVSFCSHSTADAEHAESNMTENTSSKPCDKEATLEEQVNRLAVVEKSVKKKDPCPCGSNKKYKQCCGAKRKQGARSKRPKPKMSEDDRPSKAEQQGAAPSRFQMVKI